jgi:hypothetical protein
MNARMYSKRELTKNQVELLEGNLTQQTDDTAKATLAFSRFNRTVITEATA